MRFASLSPSQSELEERLRTVCLCICAAGVVAYGLARLKFALVPLVLSLSLKYLLQPLIDALTRKNLPFESPDKRPRRWRRFRLPHSLAVLVTLCVALATLATLAAIVAESVRDFTSRADAYASQVQLLVVSCLEWLDNTGLDERWRKVSLQKFADGELSSWITATVFSLGEGLLSLLSTTMLVLLFTMYLLLTPTIDYASDDDDEPLSLRPSHSYARFNTLFSRRVDRQINSYIKGKLALSLLVGLLTAALLVLLRVDLWLAFAVVAFFANFVPNLGGVVSCALPMPVILLDPNSSKLSAFVALASLVLLHALVGNVIEPILFGNSMKLHPVVVLLSLMIWSYLWGVPGLVLAVPITAICRIYLASIDHPLAHSLAAILDGRDHPPLDASGTTNAPAPASTSTATS
ncbi:hypothetical protein CTAYLR_004263 [Chrysophaeum taylorii]|uniref:AI-2E family transporter n=1 Tax=Chrysophaeum taylorii TaxID=2483200 RepID=A0AAD7UEN1_9STRA|nr:hypothetical protein CTAYLR_004263 [Chrysophaeum taylorii]